MPEMIEFSGDVGSGKILSWVPDLEDDTLAQAERCAALPFVPSHVALMPDAHFGYGATVGSVIPTKGAIVPYAVGVDIGCGMIAADTGLTSADLPDGLQDLHDQITKAVPAGVGKGFDRFEFNYPRVFPEQFLDKIGLWEQARTIDFPRNSLRDAVNQFGTLGGGNHFVEVCLDESDEVWIVLHSGSRGVGKQIADEHIAKAKGLMEAYFIELEDPNLAYLVEGTDEFDQYIRAMTFAQDWAMGNRQAMMTAVVEEFGVFLGREVHPVDTVNCHHNFTTMENHNGRNMWITRKGAIRARVGDRGVIPGSMGAASYIVTGLGHNGSYHSCAHGAGRRMGRKHAQRTLDTESFVKSMEGIVWNQDADKLLDEDPRAYKDIDQVMAAQADLVTIEHRLTQILNYKGTK